MLQAYIDDSTTNDDDERLFLAGFVNNAESWISFSKAWDKELRSEPSIEYFKMSEAQNRQGQFYGWSEEMRDLKVKKLAGIIKNHSGLSIQCSVSRKKYNDIVRPVAPHGLGNAYFSCFYGLIFSTARAQDELGIKNIPIDFIFDEQGDMGDEAVMFYRYMKEHQQPSINSVLGSSPIFRDDKKIVPLQAADMLVWLVRREFQSPDNTGSITAQELTENCCRIETHIDEDYLHRIANGFKEIPGSQDLSNKSTWRKIKKKIKELQSQEG